MICFDLFWTLCRSYLFNAGSQNDTMRFSWENFMMSFSYSIFLSINLDMKSFRNMFLFVNFFNLRFVRFSLLAWGAPFILTIAIVALDQVLPKVVNNLKLDKST